MFRRLPVVLMTILLPLMTAAPALAQDEGGSKKGSVFKMFIAPIPANADFLDWVGVLMVWIIIAMSVVAMALIIHFWLKTNKNALVPDSTREFIGQALEEKRYREAIDFAGSDPSFLGKLVSSSLNEASNGFSAMERALEESADAEITKMLRPLETLSVIGNVAPMLGLFGTVYGMIVAFQRLVEAGGQPNPAELAGGISTALVTTFWGLVVAMPAMTAYAVIRNKLDSITSEGMVVAEELLRPFKPGGAKKPAAAAPKPAAAPRATPKPS